MGIPSEGDRPIRVTPATLAAAAGELASQSHRLAVLRDDANGAIHDLGDNLDGELGAVLTEVHEVWWLALEMMAQTTAAVADATQQAAVIYEHVDRTAIPAPPEAPPPPGSPSNPNPQFPPA